MNKQNEKLIWIGWGVIFLPSFSFAVTLLVKFCDTITKYPCSWVGLAYWGSTALLILLTVWIIYHYYSKLVETLHKQQLEKDKQEKEKELKEFLAERHHEYKLEAMKYDIQKQKLDLENKKLEMKKKGKKE